jgi:hypothetical protein
LFGWLRKVLGSGIAANSTALPVLAIWSDLPIYVSVSSTCRKIRNFFLPDILLALMSRFNIESKGYEVVSEFKDQVKDRYSGSS